MIAVGELNFQDGKTGLVFTLYPIPFTIRVSVLLLYFPQYEVYDFAHEKA